MKEIVRAAIFKAAGNQKGSWKTVSYKLSVTEKELEKGYIEVPNRIELGEILEELGYWEGYTKGYQELTEKLASLNNKILGKFWVKFQSK